MVTCFYRLATWSAFLGQWVLYTVYTSTSSFILFLMLQNHIEFESTSHVMSRDYCDLATAKVNCKSELQKRTVKVNCRRELKKWTAEENWKSELQKRTEKVNCKVNWKVNCKVNWKVNCKVNCRSVVELRNEPQTKNGVGVYLRATVSSPDPIFFRCQYVEVIKKEKMNRSLKGHDN